MSPKTDGKIVTIPARITNSEAGVLKQDVMRLLNAGERKIIFDMSATDEINGDGLQMLEYIANYVTSVNGQIILCFTNEHILAQLARENLISYFKIYDVDETVNLVILRILSEYYDCYSDVTSINVSRDEKNVHVDIRMGFPYDMPLGEVCELLDRIKFSIVESIKNAKVVIIPHVTVA
ncbi:MAG: STAS domain-containing protein [Negativicutes bacterium]|nr:STAS domain-containing protein [Negativicutes bacterium]